MLPTDTQILTERCRLRYPNEADIAHTFDASRRPGFCDGMQWDPPEKPEELLPVLARHREAWREGRAYTFAVDSREDGERIGRISVRNVYPDRPDNHEWNIGFWVHPSRWGRGYATEMARAVVDFAFREMGASDVTAACATWNKASRRVLEKIGMRFVRVDEQGFKKNGQWVAEDSMEITRAMWEQDRRVRAVGSGA